MSTIVRLLCYSTLLEMCLTYKSDGLLGFHQFLMLILIVKHVIFGAL